MTFSADHKGGKSNCGVLAGRQLLRFAWRRIRGGLLTVTCPNDFSNLSVQLLEVIAQLSKRKNAA